MPLPPLPGSPRGGDHEPDSIVAAVTSSHQSQSHSQSGKLHLICVNVCYYSTDKNCTGRNDLKIRHCHRRGGNYRLNTMECGHNQLSAASH